jgi:PKD repeat protein
MSDLTIASFVEESACAGGSFYPGKWYNYINTTSPGGQVNAEFVATPLTGAAPQTVAFTDLSTGVNILTWYWDFGDGETRLQQNPFKTYSTAGTYRVNLTVTNATSTNTTSKAAYITITNTSSLTSTKVFATDASTGGVLVGATLNLRDVENNSWVNATSGMTGTTISVLEGHTIDIYGSYPGVYTSSQELGASPGGNYYLPLMPPLPTPPGGLAGGYVNLVVNTYDYSSNNMLPSVSITAKLPSGSTTGESSGIAGTAIFLVPNNTVVILGASKTGYASMSQSINSGPGADKAVNMKMVRAVVTTAPVGPVVTDPSTGAVITAVPTIDSRTSNQKDTDMMNLLRDNGGTIISLAIVAILFGLLKMIMKF